MSPFDPPKSAPPFTQWTEIFETTEPGRVGVTPRDKLPKFDPRSRLDKTAVISDYVSVSVVGAPGYSLTVKPSEAALAFIREHMFNLERDTIYFSVIVRPNGSATVYAKYNVIIGDRVLAELTVEDIPRKELA